MCGRNGRAVKQGGWIDHGAFSRLLLQPLRPPRDARMMCLMKLSFIFPTLLITVIGQDLAS